MTAWAVDSSPTGNGEDLVAALGLDPPRPTVVLNGTTADLDPSLAADVAAAIGGLAGLASAERLALVTGGTDAAIFAVLGRATTDRSVPLVGVAPRGLVSWPGRAGKVPLEPHHTHFVLVDGATWGDETPALLALVAALTGPARSLAVVCGGGPVTRAEVEGHVRAGRPVVVLAGSGRFADELAARHQAVVTTVPLAAGPAALVGAVRAGLAGR